MHLAIVHTGPANLRARIARCRVDAERWRAEARFLDGRHAPGSRPSLSWAAARMVDEMADELQGVLDDLLTARE